MSTLPSEYFEFKSVWESIPLAERTVNKHTERLRLIEMRLPERRSDSSALTVNEKKDKKNADKSDKRPERKEQRKCFKCHKVGHLAKDCYKKYGNARNLKTAPKPAEEAFLCERHDRQDDQWLADSVQVGRRKWDKKSVAGKFVGYCDEKDGYRIWIEAEGNVIRSRDVFFKKEIPLKEKLQLLFSKKQKHVDPTSHQTEKVAVNDEPLKEGENDIDPTSHQTEKDSVNDEPLKEGDNDIQVTTSEEAVVEDGIPTSSTANLKMDEKRQQRDTKKPAYLRDYVYLAECDAPDSYAAAKTIISGVAWTAWYTHSEITDFNSA
ncbi:hypothetical protein QE152_g344 [Popillia japonica]|uniref:CCHC-type domain-containing protein n=1 Tax=Popillia japonica TaxID=7064 RepID=A0AAW1NKU0_POPJA